MKHLFLILITLCIYDTNHAQVKSVLFIGNSYTYVNDLPTMLTNVALSLGDSINHDQNTPGGSTFNGHTTDVNTLAKINLKPWDFVVLQEQSQMPSFPSSQVEEDTYPYAKKLDSLIHSNNECSETVFYMTWGRKNGDPANCPFFTPLCTYEGMQQRLRDSYLEMANDNHATVAPVGMAWKYVRSIDSTIELYNADESHPSLNGTYLAACVFYSTLFNKSSVGAYIPNVIADSTGLLLQQVASFTVLDSLQLWYHGKLFSQQFSVIQNVDTVWCADESVNANSIEWNFGDGAILTGTNVQHVYSDSGIYIITQTISNNCRSISETDTIHATLPQIISGISYYSFDFSILPNPVADKLNMILNNGGDVKFSIYDLTGRLMMTDKFYGSKTIDMSQFKSGCYLIRAQMKEKILQQYLFMKL